MGLCVGAARKTELLERTPAEKCERRSENQKRIETVRLGASILRSRLSIDTVSSSLFELWG